MKENRREMLKMSITLMVYTLIAGIALGLVYTITKDRIAEAELANVISSMESLLTDENGNAIVSIDEIKKIVLSKRNEMGNVLFTDNVGTVIAPVYEFETDSAKYYLLTGYAVGYGGNVVTMAAFKLDKTTGELSLKAIKVLDYSQETPGLGAKIADPNVQKRFFRYQRQDLAMD